MKKLIFLIPILFIYSCIVKVPPDPPTLTVRPDTNITISPISPVLFTVTGSGNEDLTGFSIETDPFFYESDTTFTTFIHEFDYKITIRIPEILPNLEDDSIVKITFKLKDYYNATKEDVYVKVLSGYPQYRADTAVLTFAEDTTMFYSTEYAMPMYFESYENLNIDLILLYDTDLGFVLASPDAFYASQKFASLGYSYNVASKNHTKIARFNTNMSLITPKFLYYMEIVEAYINDNSGSGVGEENLQIEDMLAFECDDGRKGVLQVTQINEATHSLTFFIKVQR